MPQTKLQISEFRMLPPRFLLLLLLCFLSCRSFTITPPSRLVLNKALSIEKCKPRVLRAAGRGGEEDVDSDVVLTNLKTEVRGLYYDKHAISSAVRPVFFGKPSYKKLPLPPRDFFYQIRLLTPRSLLLPNRKPN